MVNGNSGRLEVVSGIGRTSLNSIHCATRSMVKEKEKHYFPVGNIFSSGPSEMIIISWIGDCRSMTKIASQYRRSEDLPRARGLTICDRRLQ